MNLSSDLNTLLRRTMACVCVTAAVITLFSVAGSAANGNTQEQEEGTVCASGPWHPDDSQIGQPRLSSECSQVYSMSVKV